MRYIALFFLCISIFAEEIETKDMDFSPYPTPWFTGPLLAPSARVEKPGHLKVQLYWNSDARIGNYNSDWHVESMDHHFYSQEFRLQLKFGLFDRVDVQVTPRVVYRHTKDASSFHFGDLPLNLNVQILRPHTLFDGPNLKLSLLANAPTGKYRQLNPHKKKTDKSGSGCWFPGLGLNLSQFWYLEGIHYLELRAIGSYHFGVPVYVKGFNFYGGDLATNGKVYPGNYFVIDSALQYNFTLKWAAACDFRYEHFNRTRGVCKEPSGEEFSLAPVIEYNISQNMGIISGVWFTIAGRNVPQFVNGIISFSAYF